MTISLRLRDSPSPTSRVFSWDAAAPSPPGDVAALPSPPTQWLSAKDMKTYGAEPLRHDVGIVKCKDCTKPVLKSAIGEHARNCETLRKKEEEDAKKGKKRKAEDEPDDAAASKKKKGAPKVAPKGRVKGPVDFDRHCGVINDKGLPCSRSLTCKSHSMGAKRAVLGRSRPYDELLLDWNRMYNPNFVEPVKRETKAQKKEKKEKEKAEKKRLAAEAAAAAGGDPAAGGAASAVGGTTPAKKAAGAGGAGASKKKKSGAATATQGTTTQAVGVRTEEEENWDEIDSEAELDALVDAVRTAQDRGIVAVPLAVPADASSWFVARRERLRNCKELLANALVGSGGRTGLVQPRLG